MCVSNHFIEQEALNYSEKIRKLSLYKFVRTAASRTHSGEELPFISKVVLEDQDGTLYDVAPNPNGLKFALKEITYKEYKKLQQKETRNAFAIFFVILGFFGGVMGVLMKFVI